ncbi:transcription factor [Methanocella sp. CWC-04]|uniref:Transcription factor E n=1 Tax=Methanooceanicella nereidis TaxID=2052831 RepID=A0AAP2W5K6_9EURY|nr:transcription factor [Methanocella sp. CWC-04]
MSVLDNKAIRGYILRLVGDDGMTIVEKMLEKVPDTEVTDEKVAEVSGINLNLVRKTLYILYENHLAMYRRERDKDSGWLTYLWKLDLNNAEHMLKNESRKLIKKLERRLIFENNEFYICQEEPPHRILFEYAMETNFVCPVDGSPLVYHDNILDKQALQKRIEALKESVKL